MGLPISSPAPAGLLPPAAALVAPQPRHGGSSVQATAAASQAAGLCQAGAAAWGAAPRFPQEQQQQQQRHRQGLPTVSRPVPSGLPASAWGVTAPQRAGSPVDSWLAGWQRLAEAQGCAASLLDSSTAQDLLRRAAGTLRQAGATPPLAADETHTLPPRSPAPSAAASTEDSSSPLNSSGADRCEISSLCAHVQRAVRPHGCKACDARLSALNASSTPAQSCPSHPCPQRHPDAARQRRASQHA